MVGRGRGRWRAGGGSHGVLRGRVRADVVVRVRWVFEKILAARVLTNDDGEMWGCVGLRIHIVHVIHGVIFFFTAI